VPSFLLYAKKTVFPVYLIDVVSHDFNIFND
jgi:hypothetical protein